MITISRKLLALILAAALAASAGAVYAAKYVVELRREVAAIESARQREIRDEDEAIRRAIGTWKPQSPGKSY
jgi:hypothetical protein